MHAQEGRARPIGVFDSGVGGLTVLRALLQEMPDEDFVYLGDTARLPYGTKSPATVERYALQAADALIARGVKALIVACNTASAVGLPALRARHPELPVIGVVEPGAAAAVAASRTGQIAVIGTQATVRGDAYARAITALRPTAQVHALACQLFVALAEEGWTEGEVAHAVAQRYLQPLFGPGAAGVALADTLVLGCTHFPLLQPVIRTVVGPDISIVDSAATTAQWAHAHLRSRALLRVGASAAPRARALRLLATDGTAQFARVGGRFLGRAIAAADVELVDL
ncbi:MAG TPA: glutamate racemase [Steroidobacteraceae bacterium]|nr:glutamate racemase [Steroidobacteraceae bacterium]